MKHKKTVLAAVINDVSTDQRLHRTCNYLTEKGFAITAYGRDLPETFSVKRSYKIIHKKHWFNSTFLFYIEYNLRLFLFILFNKKYNYILSNDLDTLSACFMAGKIKKSELVFDSHEYFTETPEVQGRVFIQNCWKLLERYLIPRLKKAYTVSPKIAESYFKKYKIKFAVIRNVPILKNKELVDCPVSFPTQNKIMLYQGKLTKNRGLKAVIESLKYLKKIDLVVIGHGKEEQNLKNFVKQQKMNKRVHFLGRIGYEKLHNYTKQADLGILLEEPVGESFQYSLPNKLFDYIHSELPFIAYPLTEVEKIVNKYRVGVLVDNHNPNHIAEKIETLLANRDLLKKIKANQKQAKEELCWEKESKLLDNYFT